MATTLIRGLYNFTKIYRGAVVTIGNFDGVHKGHKALIMKVKARAMTLKAPALVITFEPQPAEFFGKYASVPRLTRLREKFFYLQATGIDAVLVLRFNQHLAKLSAQTFIENILAKHLQIKEIILGHDFRYGKDRAGDVPQLEMMGQNLGFKVWTMPDVLYAKERISSTRIRHALSVDDQSLAQNLLERPYAMMGRIVYGNQLGRKLGFPTANIFLHRKRTPVQGIYAVKLYGILADRPLFGVANVGTRPTVGGTKTLLEVHIFQFKQNIYGKYVHVEFCKKLRDEEYYASLDLLREQIRHDAEEALRYFKATGYK